MVKTPSWLNKGQINKNNLKKKVFSVIPKGKTVQKMNECMSISAALQGWGVKAVNKERNVFFHLIKVTDGVSLHSYFINWTYILLPQINQVKYFRI